MQPRGSVGDLHAEVFDFPILACFAFVNYIRDTRDASVDTSPYDVNQKILLQACGRPVSS